MANAPKKIWANVAVAVNGVPVAGEWSHRDVGGDDDIEYVRVDLYDKLEEENDRLRYRMESLGVENELLKGKLREARKYGED